MAQRLASVPDPRAVRGRRHPLVVILVLAACATLVVCNDSVAAIWQWAAGTSPEVLARIGARFDPLPPASGRFAGCCTSWTATRWTRRSAVCQRRGARHQLRARPAHATRGPGQTAASRRDRREPAARHRNQPLASLLYQAAQALLSGTDTEFADQTDVGTGRGRGRTERRTRQEIVYGIGTLPAELAGPAHLNHYTRGHWCVDNYLQWTSEVTFHEDNSRLRTRTAPRTLASLRNLTSNTYRLAGRANTPTPGPPRPHRHLCGLWPIAQRQELKSSRDMIVLDRRDSSPSMKPRAAPQMSGVGL